jgi:hypothetical protein
MRKRLKLLAIASALVIILVASIASVAMAAGPNPDPGTCPNPECTNVCPNPDCPNNGDQLQYRNGSQGSGSGAVQHQQRACWVD